VRIAKWKEKYDQIPETDQRPGDAQEEEGALLKKKPTRKQPEEVLG
jgi:hypothetical protein